MITNKIIYIFDRKQLIILIVLNYLNLLKPLQNRYEQISLVTISRVIDNDADINIITVYLLSRDFCKILQIFDIGTVAV
jgi:hypothetical protein